MQPPAQGYRLSPQQQRLWAIQSPRRPLRAECELEIAGELDAGRLEQAIERAAERHQVLRTTFRRSPGMRFPIQVIGERGAIAWRQTDLAGRPAAEQAAAIAAAAVAASSRPFDFERGPLLSAELFALGPRRHRLLLALPALLADAASLANLVVEIARGYASGPGGDGEAEESLPYVSFSEWQHQLLQDEEEREGREHWQRQDTATGRDVRLPSTPPEAGADGPPGRVVLRLDPALAAAVDRLAEAGQTSRASLLLAAWASLLGRLGGLERVVVGEVVDGRPFAEMEAAIGLFAHAVPVVCEVPDELPFAELAARVERQRDAAAEWQAHFVAGEAAAPGEEGGVFFSVGFAVEAWPPEREADGVRFAVARRSADADRFRLCLLAVERPDGVELVFLHDPARLAAGEVERLAQRTLGLLAAAVAAPQTAVGALPLLLPGERQRLLAERNRTGAPYPRKRCFHHLFVEQAARTPSRVAVAMAGGASLTYAELAARAESLAAELGGRGVGRGSIAGLWMERSPDMVVALLAILEAGAAYLPLDATAPPERVGLLLADSRARIVLTQSRLVQGLPAAAIEVLCLDAERPAPGGEAAAPPAAGPCPEDLAYVIYTSGSTGRPKGVMVPHRGLVNYLSWAVETYGVAEGEGAPVHSPLGFDLTVTSLLAPLLAGRTAFLLPEERGLEALTQALAAAPGFSLVKLTPAHLELLRQSLPPERLAECASALVIGGEALFGDGLAFWRQHAPATRLINEYGPTETVVGCAVYELPAGAPLPAGAVPIGRPIANTCLYVVDRRGEPLPDGVAGELLVGGDGVARGYLGNPRATAERFVPDPFSVGPAGARLYRTGDLVRWRADGELEFLGRTDFQAKIRGFRVEPGEIEAALVQHPRVGEAVVVARQERSGERRLVAYLVAEGGSPPGVDELRVFLAARLPDYMVPAVFVPLDTLPLTANGKVDRAVLPAPGTDRPDLAKAYVAPRDDRERELAAIWTEVLGIDRVGVEDSFFALGGDSIRSVRLVALAREKGYELTVEELFRFQSIAGLGAFLDARAQEEAAGAAGEEEELARLVDELEDLSEEEARELLRQKDETMEKTGTG